MSKKGQTGRWHSHHLGKPVGTHWRTCRWRARQLVGKDVQACAWRAIGHCRGPIHVAHVDQDFTNNDLSNLLALCASHHRLLDTGRIDPANPKTPEFYTDASGKRRYQYAPRTRQPRPHLGFSRAEWNAQKEKAS